MPPLIGFIGPSYSAKSPNVDVQKTVNLYPEIGEIGDEKNQEIASLVSTPGLKPILGASVPLGSSIIGPSIGLLPNAPNRGFYLTSQERLFGVTGNVFWELGDTATYTGTHVGEGDIFIVRGQLGTTVGPVSMSDNGTQIIIVDGQRGYIYDTVAETLSGIVTENNPSTSITKQTMTAVPTNASSDDDGTAVWENPLNIIGEDNQFAVQTLKTDASLGTPSSLITDTYVQDTPIPANSGILGIRFNIRVIVGGQATSSQMQVQLTKNGNLVGDPKTINVFSSAFDPQGLLDVTVGGEGDFWGSSLSLDEANNPDVLGLNIKPPSLAFISSPHGTITATFSVDSVTRDVIFNGPDVTSVSDFPDAPSVALTGGPTVVDFLDSYFIVNRADTQQFFFSGLGDGTSWDGLDVGDKEGQPDKLATLIVNYKELWLLGKQTSEVWYNSGDPDNPFQRIGGAFIEHGIAATGTLRKLLGSVIWVSQDRNGDPIVLKAVGHTPQRISTYPLEQKMKSFGKISGATAYTYQRGGHGFYCLNIPGADTTLVYDVSVGLWHDRQSLRSSGYLGRNRAENCVFFKGRHIVGDFENRNIYELDENTFTDDGEVIPRIRRAPHISKNGRPFILGSLALEMEGGLGNTEAMVRISKDYGHIWSSEKSITSKIGEYLKRFVWRQFGQARDFAVETKIISDGPVTLISLFVNE